MKRSILQLFTTISKELKNEKEGVNAHIIIGVEITEDGQIANVLNALNCSDLSALGAIQMLRQDLNEMEDRINSRIKKVKEEGSGFGGVDDIIMIRKNSLIESIVNNDKEKIESIKKEMIDEISDKYGDEIELEKIKEAIDSLIENIKRKNDDFKRNKKNDSSSEDPNEDIDLSKYL